MMFQTLGKIKQDISSKRYIYESEKPSRNENNVLDDENEIYSDNKKREKILNISTINITRLNEEYDAYIQELKKQIQFVREERKNSELMVKTIEHRITLLQNQEKYVILQFQNAKQKIEQILINRSKAEDELRKSMLKRRAKNKINNSSFGYKNHRSVDKKIKHNPYNKQYDFMNSNNNNKKFDEEKERRRIENEIAEIERQEIELLKGFRQETDNSNNYNDDD